MRLAFSNMVLSVPYANYADERRLKRKKEQR